MPYISDGRIQIQHAFEHHYAMPSFNVCSLEMARACVMAAELERAPIMLQTYPGDLKQGSAKVFASMVRALAEEATVPILLHLDHGNGLKLATQCLRAGYSSVMFDGAAYPLDENIRLTKRIAEIAHAAGAALEAAAGSFGGGEGDDEDAVLTEAEVAARIKVEAEADMVACSVGSKHGQTSQLDLGLLERIAKAVNGPIVLHGGTGIPATDLAEAVQFGVVKVNIGAGLMRALFTAWQTNAQNATTHYDVYDAARDAVIEVAREKIRIMQASSKA
jgi:ketose-bisphosphate aldolase